MWNGGVAAGWLTAGLAGQIFLKACIDFLDLCVHSYQPQNTTPACNKLAASYMGEGWGRVWHCKNIVTAPEVKYAAKVIDGRTQQDKFT